MLMNSIGDGIDLFLIAMNYSQIVLYIQSVALCFHFVFCLVFISYMGLGIQGAAWASNSSALLTIVFQVIYMKSREDLKEAWFIPNRDLFKNLGSFLSLALPGILMLTIENLNMEILVLLAGLL